MLRDVEKNVPLNSFQRVLKGENGKWDLPIFSAGNWDFHVFYHWEWDFLNASRNGKNFLKITTGISRYCVNGNEISYTNNAGSPFRTLFSLLPNQNATFALLAKEFDLQIENNGGKLIRFEI